MVPLVANLIPVARRRINIRSFDFDGCLFNDAFRELLAQAKDNSEHVKIFWDTNHTLFQAIDQQLNTEKYDHVFYTVGSARQSYSSDRRNARYNGTGSCFPYMSAIQERLKKGEVKKFLLTDLYNDRPDDTSFDEAIHLLKQKNPEPSEYGWVFDDSKFTILYAQIHKFARENPDVEIDYDFYDDREDILHPLHSVFKRFPHLLPKNVTLKMHEYSGGTIKDLNKIDGKGPIDRTYSRTVKEVVKAHGIRCCDEGTFNVLKEHHIKKILAIRPVNAPEPVYPGEPAWYMAPQTILTAVCAGIGFFATGGIGLVGGAAAGYAVSLMADSSSEINHRQ